MKGFQIQFKANENTPVWTSKYYSGDDVKEKYDQWTDWIYKANDRRLGSILVNDIHGNVCNIPESYFHNYILTFYVEN